MQQRKNQHMLINRYNTHTNMPIQTFDLTAAAAKAAAAAVAIFSLFISWLLVASVFVFDSNMFS